MTDSVFIEGQVIEGTLIGNMRSDIVMDTFLTFADFLVTRVVPSPRETAIKMRIFFDEDQTDIVNPPRNSIIRATIDTSFFAKSPYSTEHDIIGLTDIEFVERGTGRVIRQIPSAPKFAD